MVVNYQWKSKYFGIWKVNKIFHVDLKGVVERKRDWYLGTYRLGIRILSTFWYVLSVSFSVTKNVRIHFAYCLSIRLQMLRTDHVSVFDWKTCSLSRSQQSSSASVLVKLSLSFNSQCICCLTLCCCVLPNLPRNYFTNNWDSWLNVPFSPINKTLSKMSKVSNKHKNKNDNENKANKLE